jgi:hypothetical protein
MAPMPEHKHDDETEPAHDILAAEEFGMPAADPDLHAGPVVPPGDPSAGVDEPPHDVLAAEEFAMPAVHRPYPPVVAGGGGGSPLVLAARLAAAFAVGLLLARLLRRR